MTSDNIAEYVGENNQFTEKPVTEYPPVIQDNTVTTKDYLYSNNIDTDLLVGKRAARTVLTGMCYSVGSATRQGSSSPTRFIGQSAMTSRT